MNNKEKREELLRWGERNGVIRKVGISEYDEVKGYCLITEEEVGEREEVFAIPYSHCLSSFSASLSSSFSPLYTKLTSLFDTSSHINTQDEKDNEEEEEEEKEENISEVILIFFLLHEREKGEESEWKEYFPLLPSRITSPLYPSSHLFSPLFLSSPIIIDTDDDPSSSSFPIDTNDDDDDDNNDNIGNDNEDGEKIKCIPPPPSSSYNNVMEDNVDGNDVDDDKEEKDDQMKEEGEEGEEDEEGEKNEEEEELKVLEGSPLMDLIPSLLQSQWSIYSSIIQSIDDLSHYSFDDYLWAFMIINSRGFKLFPLPQPDPPTPIPNHDNDNDNDNNDNDNNDNDNNDNDNNDNDNDNDNEEEEKKEKVVTTLIPIIDMANHTPLSSDKSLSHTSYLTSDHHVKFFAHIPTSDGAKGITTGGDDDGKGDEGKGIEKGGGKRIEKGRELELTYNEFSNWQLLLYYGFALPNNPHETVLVSFEMMDEEEYEVEIKKMLFFCTGGEMGFSLEHSLSFLSDPSLFPSAIPIADHHGKGVITRKLIGSLRLAMLSKEEMEEVTMETLPSLLSDLPFSPANERAALSMLKDVLLSLLHRYPSSLVDDLSSLNSPSISLAKRNYLIYVIDQKTILSHALSEVDLLLSLL